MDDGLLKSIRIAKVLSAGNMVQGNDCGFREPAMSVDISWLAHVLYCSR